MPDPPQRKSPRKRTTSAKAKAQVLAVSPSNNTAKQRPHKASQGVAQNVQKVPPAAPKASKARKCRQCPGNPPRIECVHTKVGRQYVTEQQLRQRISAACAQSSTLPVDIRQDAISEVSGHRESESARPVSEQQIHFQNMNPQVILSHPDTPVNGLSHSPAAQEPFSSFFTPERRAGGLNPIYVLNTLPPASHINSTPITPTRRLTHAEESLTLASSLTAADSPLETPRQQTSVSSSTTTPISGLTHVYDPALNALSFTPQQFESTTPTTVQGSEETGDTPHINAGKRVKATASNPFHGNVQGVMRGSIPYSIVRHQALPAPIVESKKASKKFRDSFNSIIRKCEDLSTQTGCWLFVGAQHAAANGAPIHYASPRLCKDGGPQANALATQYLQLVKQIVDSRRVDTMELQQNLQKSKQEGSMLKDRVLELEAQVKNAERDAEKLQEYRRLLGIDDDS